VIGKSHGIAPGPLAARLAALIAVAVSAGCSMKKKCPPDANGVIEHRR
jgi:hypothetical protein